MHKIEFSQTYSQVRVMSLTPVPQLPTQGDERSHSENTQGGTTKIYIMSQANSRPLPLFKDK